MYYSCTDPRIFHFVICVNVKTNQLVEYSPVRGIPHLYSHITICIKKIIQSHFCHKDEHKIRWFSLCIYLYGYVSCVEWLLQSNDRGMLDVIGSYIPIKSSVETNDHKTGSTDSCIMHSAQGNHPIKIFLFHKMGWKWKDFGWLIRLCTTYYTLCKSFCRGPKIGVL